MARSRVHKHSLIYLINSHTRSGWLLLVLAAASITGGHFVLAAANAPIAAQVVMTDNDPNFHVKTIATQFFEDNDAAEMISIIECESHFRQFETDGTPLKNREGSSAIGVAQILASKHPDHKIVDRYNRRFDMDMTISDFDLTTLEGNLGYALVLYKVRGTRDWECGKRFGFN